MGSTAEDLITEVTKRALFVEKQRSTRHGKIGDLQKEQCGAFIQSVAAAGQLDLDNATSLTSAIYDSGTWTDDEKGKMGEAVASSNAKV